MPVRRRSAAIVSTLLLLAVGLVTAATPANAAPPPNDAFAAAQPIGYGVFGTDNTEATMQMGEPQPSCTWESPETGTGDAEASVWYRFTAPETGDVRMHTLDSSILVDTQIAVYTGTSLTGLTEVACSEDLTGSYLSDLTHPVTAGEVLYVQVTTWTGDEQHFRGPITLDVSGYTPPDPPANDDFAAAQPVMPGQTPGTNRGATLETGEPEASCLMEPQWATGASVWFSFTAPADTSMAFGTTDSPTPFDTVVTVYTGPGLGDLTEVACDDEGDPITHTSIAYADVVTGTTYWVRVAGWAPTVDGSPATGDFVLTVAEGSPPPAGPANDAIGNAQQIAPGSHSGSTVDATTEEADLIVNGSTGCNIEDTVWYLYAPEASGTATVDLTGSGFDTALGYVEVDDVGMPTAFGCDEDSGGGGNAALSVAVTPGMAYLFQVGSTVGQEGPVSLTLAGPGGAGNDGDPRVGGRAAKAPGTQIAFTVDVSTDETGGYPGGTLTIDPPAGVTVGALSPEPGLFCGSGNPIVCQVDRLAAQQTTSLRLLVTPRSEGPFRLDASLESLLPPPRAKHPFGSRPAVGLRTDDPANNAASIVASRKVVCDNKPTSGANKASGTGGGDILCGLGGGDTLKGLGGDDLLFGGDGRDTLLGGAGKDKLYGAAGADDLVGGLGRDLLIGGGGRDRCRESSDTQQSCER